MSTVVGLTGQSGAGKTLVSRVFEDNGFGVINCDTVARNVTETGSACNKELSKYFPTCFDEKLELDRHALGSIVFSHRDKLDILNRIIFRYIRELIDENIAELSKDHSFILLDAPTLFEAGADEQCDIIVSVTADSDIRLKRIIMRDGLDEDSVLKRFESQHSEDFFRAHSDYVIENNGDTADTIVQTKMIIDKIKEDNIGSN